MIITFSVGSRCAVMLPRKFLNAQVTPAKGLVINRLIDSRSLVLVEEVWQFSGLEHAPLEEMCFPSGRIRQSNWGWYEVPEILEDDDYLVVPAAPHNMMPPSPNTLEVMIRQSIADFKNINGFV